MTNEIKKAFEEYCSRTYNKGFKGWGAGTEHEADFMAGARAERERRMSASEWHKRVDAFARREEREKVLGEVDKLLNQVSPSGVFDRQTDWSIFFKGIQKLKEAE